MPRRASGWMPPLSKVMLTPNDVGLGLASPSPRLFHYNEARRLAAGLCPGQEWVFMPEVGHLFFVKEFSS